MGDSRDRHDAQEHGGKYERSLRWQSGSTFELRPSAIVAGVALLVLVTFVGYTLLRSDDDQSDTLPPLPTSEPATPSGGANTGPDDDNGQKRADDAYEVAPWTSIATLGEDITGYSKPGGESTGTIRASWHGRPSALPVIGQKDGWLRVRLPQRPNGSTAWIRGEDVEVTSTPYRIVIDVATTRLWLYKSSEVVLDAPAGIGTDEAPTTVGKYFVTFLQEPPDDDNWGPFVMVTSAHSETISDWQESGDAIAAIHGPLDSAKTIGNTGAKVSNGCIRLHLDDLAALRDVPVGSPIDVIDSSQAGART